MVDSVSVAALVPRTLYHIQSLSDSAISGRWIVTLPSPELFNNLADQLDVEQRREQSSLVDSISQLAGEAKSAYNTAKSKVSSALGSTPIMMRALEVGFILPKTDTVNLKIQSRSFSIPSGETASSFSMTFLEGKSFECVQYFELWRSAYFNRKTGAFGVPFSRGNVNGYCQDMEIHVFDSAGVEQGVGKIYACFPTDVTLTTFGNKSELVKVTVTFESQTSEWISTSGLLQEVSRLYGNASPIGQAISQGISTNF